MKNLTTTKKAAVTVLAVIILAVFSTNLYSQAPVKKHVSPARVEIVLNSELAMKNLEMALSSDNPGLRMSAIQFVGKYKITAFEDELLDMLYESNNFKEQRSITVSLYKLGTLSSIASIIEYGKVTDSKYMKEFCKELVSHYQKEEIEKSKYINSLVIDSEISE